MIIMATNLRLIEVDIISIQTHTQTTLTAHLAHGLNILHLEVVVLVVSQTKVLHLHRDRRTFKILVGHHRKEAEAELHQMNDFLLHLAVLDQMTFPDQKMNQRNHEKKTLQTLPRI
jgi:hypothetical protein